MLTTGYISLILFNRIAEQGIVFVHRFAA